jgi:hypothetical protein
MKGLGVSKQPWLHSETLAQKKKSQVPVDYICNPSYLEESRFKASPGKIIFQSPISKITTAKWTRGVA